MLRIPRRQIWTQQPQAAAQIDWDNPLTDGLVLCASPSNGFRETITGQTFQTFGAAPIISKNPRGLAYDSRNAFGGLILPQAKSVATDASTQFVLMDYEAKAGAWSGLFCISSASGSTLFAGIQDCGSATFGYYPTPVGWWDSTVPSSTYGIQSVALAGDAANSRIYKNGDELSPIASAVTPLADSRVVLFSERTASAAYAVKGRIYLYLAWLRRLRQAEIQQLHINPWQILRAPDRYIWVPVGAGAGIDLSGNAQASANASGALATGIPLAGHAAANATADGALQAQIKLDGDAHAQATAAADLGAQIQLAGDAHAQAGASGTLAVAASLAGAALAVASASGALVTQIPIAGAAVALASASGTLSTGIPLDGHAFAAALASGGLTAQIQLDGAALAQATAAAGLGAQIRLAGDAHGQASAGGTLAADPASLAGNAAASATASGNLATAVTLDGHAAASAAADGALQTQIDLDGAAHAQATAAADLDAQIRLSGDAHGQAAASGTLAADPSSLAGNAQAQVTVVATLSTQIIRARSGAGPNINKPNTRRPAQHGGRLSGAPEPGSSARRPAQHGGRR